MATNIIYLVMLGSIFYGLLEQFWTSLQAHGKHPPRWLPAVTLCIVMVALVLPVVMPEQHNPFLRRGDNLLAGAPIVTASHGRSDVRPVLEQTKEP